MFGILALKSRISRLEMKLAELGGNAKNVSIEMRGATIGENSEMIVTLKGTRENWRALEQTDEWKALSELLKIVSVDNIIAAVTESKGDA